MKTVQYWVIVVLLIATAVIMHLRGNTDRIPPSAPLSQFPLIIGPWTGQNMSINPAIVAVLGNGDFLSRLYTAPGTAAPIDLFIGYFPMQRTGQTIHSPKNCLPGAGWSFESYRYAHFLSADHQQYNIGEYLISNGESRQFVIYWYQAHGRSTAGEYMAKIHMVVDAIRMDRTDGALVRVITPIEPNETFNAARTRSLHFSEQMAPLLSQYIPR